MIYNKARVTVCGKEYVLKTSEDPAYLVAIGKQLDEKISELLNSDDTVTLTTAAILVGLELLDERLKTNSDIDNIRTQITSYVEEASAARLACDKLREKNEQLQREIDKLRTDLELNRLKGTLNND